MRFSNVNGPPAGLFLQDHRPAFGRQSCATVNGGRGLPEAGWSASGVNHPGKRFVATVAGGQAVLRLAGRFAGGALDADAE